VRKPWVVNDQGEEEEKGLTTFLIKGDNKDPPTPVKVGWSREDVRTPTEIHGVIKVVKQKIEVEYADLMKQEAETNETDGASQGTALNPGDIVEELGSFGGKAVFLHRTGQINETVCLIDHKDKANLASTAGIDEALGNHKIFGFIPLPLRCEWYIRLGFDFMINSLVRKVVLLTAPIIFCTEEPLDFIKDCLAVFFISTLDDTSPGSSPTDKNEEIFKVLDNMIGDDELMKAHQHVENCKISPCCKEGDAREPLLRKAGRRVACADV